MKDFPHVKHSSCQATLHKPLGDNFSLQTQSSSYDTLKMPKFRYIIGILLAYQIHLFIF
jgi:hypothetical protein